MTQSAFAAALLDPAQAPPPGLTDGTGAPARRRYDVYRNNVTAGLADALESAFPVVRRLVGDAFFRAMALVFVRAHPPRSPVMMLYGADLSGFLETFPPVAHLPYLPDVARLEQALRTSYHAADASPLDPAALGRIPPDRLGDIRLTFAPAVALLRSDWPIHGIWRANTAPEGPAPAMAPETALVTRPLFDPEVTPLAPRAAAFVAALLAGQTLGAALAAAGDGFEPGPTLARLLAQGAMTDLQTGA